MVTERGAQKKAIGEGRSKLRRSDAEKKPAATPRPSDELLELMSDYDISVGGLALELRAMIYEEAPAAHEILFKSYVLAMSYSFTPKWRDGFCYIAVYPRHTNLGFNRGAELDDPKGLLVGSGKAMRHIKVSSPEDLTKPHLRQFIKAAIRHAKKIASAKPRSIRAK
jgi:hypothetical protein